MRELEAQVEQLEERLERERQNDTTRRRIDDIDFLEQFLTTDYKRLPELLQEIVETGELDELIRKPIEDELYYLAAQNRVEYERGHGWRLTEGGEQ